MDIGIGLGIGAVIGVGIGFLVVMLRAAFHHGVTKARATTVIPMPVDAPPGDRAAGGNTRVAREGSTKMLDRETKLLEAMNAKENKLGKAVSEVRDMVLKVADIVTRTNDASGEATKAFNSAKTNLDAISITDSDDQLLAAHAMLLREINSVINTNEKLQNELESAKTGIAEQRRLIEELRNAVRIDSLTQLPNRAAFDERIKEFLRRLDRTNEVFSLLLVDIDYFKKVNDTYGHVNGDRILKGIASKMKENVRANDFPARYGGEEFAVILPDTDIQVAQSVAERMRQDIARTNFKLDGKDIRITISGGLAESKQGQTPEELICLADKALYRSKAEGRNRVTCDE